MHAIVHEFAGGGAADPRQAADVEIEITDEARRLLEKKGGSMAIDFIRPTG